MKKIERLLKHLEVKKLEQGGILDKELDLIRQQNPFLTEEGVISEYRKLHQFDSPITQIKSEQLGFGEGNQGTVSINTDNIKLNSNGSISGGIIKLTNADGTESTRNITKVPKKSEVAGIMGGNNQPNVPWGMIGDTAIAATNAVEDALMGDKNFSASSNALDSAVDATASAASKFGPWGLLCVCAGTKIITNNGEEKNIEDLKIEDGILGYKNNKIIQQSIEELFSPMYKECVQIETHGGNILRCSIDHPIFAARVGRAERTHTKERHRVKDYKFIEANNLKEGDFVAEAGEIPFFGLKHIKTAYLLGLLIGDGTYGSTRGKAPKLFTGDLCTWNWLENNNFGKLTKIYLPGDKYNKEFREYTFHKFLGVLREFGIYGQTKSNKRLPVNLHEWDKESCSKLLSGLFDTDGFVISTDVKNSAVCFAQSNLELIKQVKSLLLRFGIHSTIIYTKGKSSNIKGRICYSKPGYVLRIKSKESIEAFYNNITLNIDYKQKSLLKVYLLKQRTLTRDNSLKYYNIHADKIKRIVNLGYCLVYNLRVGDSHTYLANGIITHNTAGALKTFNFITKIGGKTVQGFDVNEVDNSGYSQDMFHQQSESGRIWDNMSGKLKRRNARAKMALAALDVSNDEKYEQEARTNSVTNVLQLNQIALAGGIDPSLLAS